MFCDEEDEERQRVTSQSSLVRSDAGSLEALVPGCLAARVPGCLALPSKEAGKHNEQVQSVESLL